MRWNPFGRRRPVRPTRPRPSRFSRSILALERLEDRITPTLPTIELAASSFELDGNATTQTAHDWDQVYNDAVVNPGQNTSGSIPGAVAFIHDTVNGNNSGNDGIFTGGQSKDTTDVNQWLWTKSAPQDKADLA